MNQVGGIYWIDRDTDTVKFINYSTLSLDELQAKINMYKLIFWDNDKSIIKWDVRFKGRNELGLIGVDPNIPNSKISAAQKFFKQSPVSIIQCSKEDITKFLLGYWEEYINQRQYYPNINTWFEIEQHGVDKINVWIDYNHLLEFTTQMGISIKIVADFLDEL